MTWNPFELAVGIVQGPGDGKQTLSALSARDREVLVTGCQRHAAGKATVAEQARMAEVFIGLTLLARAIPVDDELLGDFCRGVGAPLSYVPDFRRCVNVAAGYLQGKDGVEVIHVAPSPGATMQ
jgi:hypothetical protein